MSLRIDVVRTLGLGDSTYVLVFDGLGAVVDPQRDIDRFEAVLNQTGADLRFVIETHLHNDYISGGNDLARKTGAELIMPASAAPVFRHRPAFHHENIVAGNLAIRPIHTPGHTPEHTSYLIVIEGREKAVFSGGSLLVGSAGRTDLLGDDRAESLARLQYQSVNRLAALPDAVEVLPTHGAGSFCTTTDAGSLTSTIGVETESNRVLAYADEDEFVKGQLSGLVPYPSYYRHMGPANLTGLPAPTLEVPVLDTIPQGVIVVDGRPTPEFAAGHIPGSLGVELRDSFGTWVGWVTEHNAPIVLVLNEDQDTTEAVRQLIRIGYDDIRGVVHTLTGDLESFATVDIATFNGAITDGAQIVDSRAPDEWELGTIHGSILSYVPDFAMGTPSGLDTSNPVWIACETGYRAAIVASILQDRGFEPVVLTGAGVTDLLKGASESS